MGFYYGLIVFFTVVWTLLRLKGRSNALDKVFLVIAFAVLAVVAASRYDLGFDYSYVYAPGYEPVLMNPDYAIGDSRFEPGYEVLEQIVASLSRNFHMIFVVTGILVAGLLIASFWIQSPNVFVSVFFFLTLSQYYCTLNFVRQSLAGLLVTLAIPLLKRRKPLHMLLYLPVVALAASIHVSALIMIPFMIVNLLPMQNKWVLLGYGLVTVAIYLNIGAIVDVVTQYWYTQYRDNIHLNATFTPQFAIAAFVWFLVMLLGAKAMTAKDKSNYIYINYAYFYFFFVLLGTRHSILDRMSVYFMFSIPIGLAILLEGLMKKEDGTSVFQKEAVIDVKRRVQFVMTAAVTVVGSLLIHHYGLMMDHHGVVPYETIWEQPFYAVYKEELNQTEEMVGDMPEDLTSIPSAGSDLGPDIPLPD